MFVKANCELVFEIRLRLSNNFLLVTNFFEVHAISILLEVFFDNDI